MNAPHFFFIYPFSLIYDNILNILKIWYKQVDDKPHIYLEYIYLVGLFIISLMSMAHWVTGYSQLHSTYFIGTFLLACYQYGPYVSFFFVVSYAFMYL
ncbi:hypothetical protein HanHA89_Chr06g0217591 [Helianthus annuus]|nr:hypothetical protein HanHA89_Chr06g0217591 [Helianthus annuus]